MKSNKMLGTSIFVVHLSQPSTTGGVWKVGSGTASLMHADVCLACGTSALIWWLEWTVPTYHVRMMRHQRASRSLLCMSSVVVFV
jgi:hypothetical protein